MLPSETMIWQPEFTDKTLSRKPGAVHRRKTMILCASCHDKLHSGKLPDLRQEKGRILLQSPVSSGDSAK
ncbi:hypothetical protein [Escherichia coli]|uniref:hypothetical protein n=1 Tax=Escherichia coli TaxID=562 RepID=UPI000BE55AF6|nr:hypothetical protein [Escherichia coli]